MKISLKDGMVLVVDDRFEPDSLIPFDDEVSLGVLEVGRRKVYADSLAPGTYVLYIQMMGVLTYPISIVEAGTFARLSVCLAQQIAKDQKLEEAIDLAIYNSQPELLDGPTADDEESFDRSE